MTSHLELILEEIKAQAGDQMKRAEEIFESARSTRGEPYANVQAAIIETMSRARSTSQIVSTVLASGGAPLEIIRSLSGLVDRACSESMADICAIAIMSGYVEEKHTTEMITLASKLVGQMDDRVMSAVIKKSKESP